MRLADYNEKKTLLLFDESNGVVKGEEDCICEDCIKCGGACCKSSPCTLSPREFLDIEDLDYMKSILDLGVLSIFPLNIRGDIFAIRARGLKDLDTIVTGYIAGYNYNECILLGSKGCVLDYTTRPTEGLLLIPKFGTYDIELQLYDAERTIDEWKACQKAVLELKKYYKDREIIKPEATKETALIYKNKLLGN